MTAIPRAYRGRNACRGGLGVCHSILDDHSRLSGDAFVLGGTYREVDPPARLVYTWRWETGPAADGSESLVTVEFHDKGDKTELALTHSDFPEAHGPDPYKMGWEGGLEKLLARFDGSGANA